MNEHMRTYIRTVVIVVKAIFVVVGGGFSIILLPELYRLYSDQSWDEFGSDAMIGAFAIAACIAGLLGAELVKRYLLNRV